MCWQIEECVDGLVTDFLVDDKMPARETTCDGYVADDFVPLALADASEYTSPLEALSAADNEINYLPEYYYSISEDIHAAACPYGGNFTFTSGDTSDTYTLTDCSFSAGFVMTGTGSYNYDDGSFTLEVSVTGLKDGTLTYVRDVEYTLHVTGEYDGDVVDLSE